MFYSNEFHLLQILHEENPLSIMTKHLVFVYVVSLLVTYAPWFLRKEIKRFPISKEGYDTLPQT
jgi:hypothetical protein